MNINENYQNPTCFGIGRPSSGSLLKKRKTLSTRLASFVIEDSSRMAPRCRNMYEFDICKKFYFMISISFILVSVFGGKAMANCT